MGKMRKYFRCGAAEPKIKTCASAFLSYCSIPKGDYVMEFTNKVIENYCHVVLQFELVKLTKNRNGISVGTDLSEVDSLWNDYLLNQFAWPIFSEKLKNLISENLRQHQIIKWIQCEIKHNEEIKNYYIPIYQYEDNVLDTNNTIFVGNTNLIIVPAFKSEVIDKLDFFKYPGETIMEPDFYISDILKRKFDKAGITGIRYDKNVSVTH